MPPYEYRCNECGHEFEVFQNMSDDPVKTCPVCNGCVERLISAGGGLLFKGSGFYTTDYRSDSYKKAAKEDKKPPKAEKTKTETKKEVTAKK